MPLLLLLLVGAVALAASRSSTTKSSGGGGGGGGGSGVPTIPAGDPCAAQIAKLPNTLPAYVPESAVKLPMRDWVTGVYLAGTPEAREFVAKTIEAEGNGAAKAAADPATAANIKITYDNAAACLRKPKPIFPLDK